jgi:hypothetical protein
MIGDSLSTHPKPAKRAESNPKGITPWQIPWDVDTVGSISNLS